MAEKQKLMRCAVYTRKSTDEGLEQEFNSLDAQREAAEAFIASQRHEGWQLLPERYDDGGCSGGTMDRPALKRLLADIEAGEIDCVVVYKVDRLSRSLLDFARLIDAFDKQGVSFVSVTQQFNTSHSLGRLTLNILLSFAQFEREIIAERTRDNLCQTYSRWVQVSKQLEQSGLIFRTKSGYVQQSPLLGVVNTCIDQINRLARELGLSPSARTRVHAAEEPQPKSKLAKLMEMRRQSCPP